MAQPARRPSPTDDLAADPWPKVRNREEGFDVVPAPIAVGRTPVKVNPVVALTVGVITLLVACGDSGASSSPSAGSATDSTSSATPTTIASESSTFGLPDRSTWILQSGELDGAPLEPLDDHPIRLIHLDGEVAGQSSCNDYGGKVAPNPQPGAPVITDVVSTLAACVPEGYDELDNPVMELEEAFLTSLRSATSLHVDDGQLKLVGPSSGLVLVRATVADAGSTASSWPDESLEHTWWLEGGTIDGAPIEVPKGVRVVLVVGRSQLSGQVACKGYAAFPVVDGDAFRMGDLEIGGDRCEEHAETQTAYLDAFRRTTSIHRTDDQRLVLAGDGTELAYTTQEPDGLPPEG